MVNIKKNKRRKVKGEKTVEGTQLVNWIIYKNQSSDLFVFIQSQNLVGLFETPWLYHSRLPCPSRSPRLCSNSCALSWCCYLTILRHLLLFPSVFQSIRVFSKESALCIRWPKYWSFSFSILLPINIQGWFSLGLTGLILQSKRLLRFFSSTIWKHQFFGAQPSLCSNSHIHTRLLEKPKLWLYRSLLAKWRLWFLIRCLGLL